MVDKSTGVIKTVAGTGKQGYSGNGGAATLAELGYPTSIAFDTSGNLYIACGPYGVVRMVDMSTGIISTAAGAAQNGDRGQATSVDIGYPYSIAIDKLNNMYISDVTRPRIRKVVLSTGIISTVAGTGIYAYNNANIGDGGPATSANLSFIGFMAVDSSGNLYFPDIDRSRIRKVDMNTGIISTVAGTDANGYTGDGGPATSAELSYPYGVAVDKVDNLFISDTVNHVVRMVTKRTGLISTVAGNGTFFDSDDSGPATSASFYYPFGIAVDASGTVYVADAGDSDIRAFYVADSGADIVPSVSTAHRSVDFLGCTDLVLQAQAAITFGGAHTSITGDIGISPGTSITGDYAIGNNGMTHINEGPSLTCAKDMGTIAAQAAALPCTNIPAELGKDNESPCVIAIFFSVRPNPTVNHTQIILAHCSAKQIILLKAAPHSSLVCTALHPEHSS